MITISESQLLDVWEQGWGQPAPARALLLLAADRPDVPQADHGLLKAGARDARLLQLRQRLFGPAITGSAECPDCSERVEFSLDTNTLLAAAQTEDSLAEVPALVVREGNYEVCARLPNADDLVAIAAMEGLGDPAEALLARCVITATNLLAAGKPAVRAGSLPETVLQAVSRRMAEADPLADIRLSLSCPSCHGRWRLAFDIVEYFWTELDAWARRLMEDLHTLASVYGWDEPTTLSVSPWRRECYLCMIRG